MAGMDICGRATEHEFNRAGPMGSPIAHYCHMDISDPVLRTGLRLLLGAVQWKKIEQVRKDPCITQSQVEVNDGCVRPAVE